MMAKDREMTRNGLNTVKYYHSYTNSSFSQLHIGSGRSNFSSLSSLTGLGKMQGAKRVIYFCITVIFLPIIILMIPLYLRHNHFAPVKYTVAESDILEMANGVSSVFCQEHTLKMNTPFNAFQAKGKPVMSSSVKKHVRLKKSMSLPDDTLEYWGFFLPKSSKVFLKVCSRYDGSRILVVKGEKNLRNCGLMQPTKPSGHLSEDEGNIQVKYEDAEQIEVDRNEKENIGAEMKNHEDYKKEPILPTNNHGGEVKDDKEENKTNSHPSDIKSRLKALELELDEPTDLIEPHRKKRQVPTYKLDGGIAHGGNALNYSERNNESSVSSFENSLLTCYNGQILLSESFEPSKQCNGTSYLESGKHMTTTHEVRSDGYYYYIFYSDNDYVQNDIFAIFDIHKPTYQYGNYTVGCINQTNCSFPVAFWSNDVVVVEVPTRDGIENENDDITILTSICHPRTAIYLFFPISILFLIVLCAFY